MSYWYVDGCVERDSRKYPNASCFHISLINIQTRERRNTYVETLFKNYKNWSEIIHTHPQGQIITNLLLLDKNLVDADSQPQQVFVTDPQQMKELLDEKWQSIPK